MLRPRNEERRWRFEELEAYMKSHCRDHPKEERAPIAFCEDAWVPFPTLDTDHDQSRCIRMLNTRHIGAGSFGIVFAVAVSLPMLPADDGEMRYVPAAMKVATRGGDHFDEVISALVLNDIPLTGMSPNINRIIDAFAISPVQPNTAFPPASWTRYWGEFSDFVYDRRVDMGKYHGHLFEVTRDDAGGSVTLPRNLSLCFSFFELAPNFLDPNIAAVYEPSVTLHKSASEGLKPPSPLTGSGSRQHTGPQVSERQARRRAVLGYAWQALHGINAMHAVGLLHCDPHGNNIVNHGNGHMRSSFCRLSTRQSDADMAALIGDAARGERPSDNLCQDGAPRYYGVPLRLNDNPKAQHRVVALGPDIPQVAWIDYGSVVRTQVRRYLPYKPTRDYFAPDCHVPRYVISDRERVYQGDARLQGAQFTPLPGCIKLHGPVTVIYSRAPELLNPRVETEHDEIIYSELSDVFAVATSIAEHILGFHIFHSRVRATPSNAQTADSMGIRCNLHEKRPPTSNGWIGNNLSTGTVMLKMALVAEDPEKTKERDERTGRTRAAGVPNHHDKDRWALIETPLYPQLRDAVRRMMGPQNSPKHNLVGQWLGKNDDLTCNLESIVNRVLALGAPSADLLQGTLLGPAIKEAGLLDMKQSHSGWLRDVLLVALTARYGVERPLAMDFTDLMMNALSWDPADRPSASDLLRCSIFSYFYTDIRKLQRDDERAGLPLAFHQLWSADLPSTSTCLRDPVAGARAIHHPSSSSSSSAATATPSAVRPLYASPHEPTPYSQLAPARCCAVDRFERAQSNLYTIAGLNVQQLPDYRGIHPDRSRLLWQFSLRAGGLDAFDGRQLVPCWVDPKNPRDVAGYSQYCLASFPVKFFNKKHVGYYLQTLGSTSLRLPPWMLDVDAHHRHKKAIEQTSNLPCVATRAASRRLASLEQSVSRTPQSQPPSRPPPARQLTRKRPLSSDAPAPSTAAVVTSTTEPLAKKRRLSKRLAGQSGLPAATQ